MSKLRRKRVVAISDPHSGHRVGLTPPDYQWIVSRRTGHIWRKYARIQVECWKWYAAKVAELRPIDVLLVGGDCVDGPGPKSGGVELITKDRTEQKTMAVECIAAWESPKIDIARGTPYHAGQEESWEDVVAESLRAGGCEVKIGDHEWIGVGFDSQPAIVTFDLKHHVGASQIPHGRATAVKRDEMWNVLWAEAGLQPRGDWILRGHVHYSEGHWRVVKDRLIWAVTLPALQAMGSRHGARRCSGLVDFGLMHWDIYEDGRVTWELHLLNIKAQRAVAWKV